MKCLGSQKSSKHVKIILLDDQEIIQEIQRTGRGQELLDYVFRHLNIIETSYFGLRYVDNTGQAHWLDPGKNVYRQLRGTDPAICYFGVKFYAADPCKLLEEITRYQFFLQIKKDILLGRLAVSPDFAAQLAAYAVQSELGDFDPKRHVKGYISEFRFVSNQTLELEDKITELHQSLSGEVPAIAELNYLEKVKWLDMYGVDLHPVLGEDKIDYFLGLTPSGIIVLRNKNKVGNYFWPRITKLTMKGKYFMIRVKNRMEEDTYGFETPSKAACKHLWKCASDHHTFFKLVQVTPTPNTNLKKTFSLNSRFRSSNRSNLSSASRRRAQPQFIRTPSRRYTRRFVEGSESNADNRHENGVSQNSGADTNQVPQNLPNWRPIPHSPKSIKSVPAHTHNQSGNSHQVSSPKSTRSRKRSKSIESNSSYDDHSHRRRSSGRSHHSRRKHKHGSSSKHKQSDGESEVSTNSRASSKRRYKHKSNHGEQSGSDSEDHSLRRRRHRHRSSSKKNDVIEWKEAKMSTIQQSVSNVKTLGNENPESSRHTSYNDERKHLHRSRRSSPKPKRTPSAQLPAKEIQKYFNYDLIDPEGLDSQNIQDLHYTPVVTSGEVNMKNRVLMKQYRKKANSQIDPSESTQRDSLKSDASLYQSHNSLYSRRGAVKLLQEADRENRQDPHDSSPPPPYSASNRDFLPSDRHKPAREHHFHSLKRTTNEPQPTHVEKLESEHDKLMEAGINRLTPTTRIDASVVKEHLENSDSGLGTDREYPNRQASEGTEGGGLPFRVGATNTSYFPNSNTSRVNYWANTSGNHFNWGNQSQGNGTLQRASPSREIIDPHHPVELHRNRSSSLEMILSPLVSSTTNRTRL